MHPSMVLFTMLRSPDKKITIPLIIVWTHWWIWEWLVSFRGFFTAAFLSRWKMDMVHSITLQPPIALRPQGYRHSSVWFENSLLPAGRCIGSILGGWERLVEEQERDVEREPEERRWKRWLREGWVRASALLLWHAEWQSVRMFLPASGMSVKRRWWTEWALPRQYGTVVGALG